MALVKAPLRIHSALRPGGEFRSKGPSLRGSGRGTGAQAKGRLRRGNGPRSHRCWPRVPPPSVQPAPSHGAWVSPKPGGERGAGCSKRAGPLLPWRASSPHLSSARGWA